MSVARAQVAIIGAGVMGASVAFHLQRLGVRDLLLIDRGAAPGAGSTSRATGGFRAQYGSAINIRLSLLSRQKLLRFADEVGADCGYEPVGYLWLASTAVGAAELREANSLQRSEGLHEAALVTPAEIAALNPAVERRDILGGAFCPSDGFIKPMGILSGYLAAARREGARILWNCELLGAQRRDDGTIAALETSAGRIEADSFVLASGAWAGESGARLGVEIPVTPLRRQVVPTAPTDLLPASMPMTIFCEDGFHLRVRDGRVLLLWPTPGIEGRPFDDSVDSAWIDAVAQKAHARVPALRAAAIDRAAAWGGLYEISPDKHALLGAAHDCSNLFLIAGSSGHGVMHAPALGELLAALITGGRTAIDTRPLRPERFADRDPVPAPNLL